MKSFTILALSICLLQAITNNAQSVITEWSLPGEIENIQLYPTPNAMYLSYADNRSHSDFEIFQIRSDGTYRPILFEQRERTALVGVRDDGDNTLFYYLAGKTKAMSLIALKYNHNTEKGTWLKDEFKIDGAVVGIPGDEIFSMIVYNKETNQLRFLRFNELTANTAAFTLPFKFADIYTNITYIPNDSLTAIAQGAAKFKLYKKGENLILSFDESFTESSKKDPRTTVITFDLIGGTQTVKKFHTKTKLNFRTFLYKDLLYRSSASKKRFELEVIDFNSGEVIQKKQLVRDTLFKESFVYLRNGKTYRVSKRESLYHMMSTSKVCEPSIIVLPTKDSCNSTIIWGTFYADENGGMIVPAGIGISPLVGIAVMAIGTAIMQQKTPTTISRYFYMNTNCQHDFSDSNGVISKRQMIDEYERSLDDKRIYFKSKLYSPFQNNTIGVYYNERTLKLTLVKL